MLERETENILWTEVHSYHTQEGRDYDMLIVTKDSVSDETWIYDKIATEASYSRSGQSVTTSAGVAGGAAGLVDSVLILGGIGGGVSKSSSAGAGASGTTQKTLTVVIKFDKSSLVKDFSYHTSKF